MLPKVIFDDDIDGPYLFVDWQSYLTPIWIWFTFLLSVLSNIIHILIIWHILKSPLRMIDLILLGDQIIQLASDSIVYYLLFQAWFLGETISQNANCYIFMYAVSFSMWERVVGGFVMALIRYIHVKKQSWILSIGNSMTLTMAFLLHFLLLAIGVGHQVVSDLTTGAKLKNSLCFGISFELFEMIQAHRGISEVITIIGKATIIAGVALRIALVILELAIYITLFKELKNSNERLKNSLPKKQLNYRSKKNAISLKSQIMSFSVETAFLVFLLVAHILAKRFHLSPSTLYCIGVLEVGLSNLTLFVSSPELRRRYFGADDTWVPKYGTSNPPMSNPTGIETTQAPNSLAYPSQPSLKTTRNRNYPRHRHIQSTLSLNPPGMESTRHF